MFLCIAGDDDGIIRDYTPGTMNRQCRFLQRFFFLFLLQPGGSKDDEVSPSIRPPLWSRLKTTSIIYVIKMYGGQRMNLR